MVRLLLARGAERSPRDHEGRSVEAYMATAVQSIKALIGKRGQSRAWRPTAHLEDQLDELIAQHAAIREFLVQ